VTRLWVDANVLLRFLTGEPKDLAGKAASFTFALIGQGEPLP
jgi:hypothetical protein